MSTMTRVSPASAPPAPSAPSAPLELSGQYPDHREEHMSTAHHDHDHDQNGAQGPEQFPDQFQGQSRRSLVGYPPPPPHERLGVVDAAAGTSSALMSAVAAHGGGGATVIAARIGFIADAGGAFPNPTPAPSPQTGSPARVVLCATETVTGINAAHRAVLQHLNGLGGDSELIALVTHPVHPGWVGKKTPKQIAHRLALLDDPNLCCPVIRAGFDPDVALCEPEQLVPVNPAQVVEFSQLNAKEQTRMLKKPSACDLDAGVMWVDLAAQLLSLAAHASHTGQAGERR